MFQFSLKQSQLRKAITKEYYTKEELSVRNLLEQISFSEDQKKCIEILARDLINKVRNNKNKSSAVNALMNQFSLSTQEGVALMCLAESLLRIPDKVTQNKLIKDKLSLGDWRAHLNQSPSLFVNAASWGLLLTGKLISDNDDQSLSAALTRIISKGGEPLIRKAIDFAMRLLGNQFVIGQDIKEALKNCKEREKLGYRFSFDMLGESALTDEDAKRYYQDYIQAISYIGKYSDKQDIYNSNGISVKISAIHPRYSRNQYNRVIEEIYPKLKELFLLAKKYNIGLNIDAEEATRLDLSLDLLELIAKDKDLKEFNGIGFVVQAYQKRSIFVIDYLIDLAKKTDHRFMVRLVKGAYWDSEIKLAQVDGLEDYPVYTRKVHTDVSYFACAKKLLSAQDVIFPQFASHNAYTVSAISNMAKGLDYEFQCLHGMGESLYDFIIGEKNFGQRVRIYAPVGTHNTLLAYLVRRLIENGANSSFVNQIVDKNISVDRLVQNPMDKAKVTLGKMHNCLTLPKNIYKDRLNSKGLDLSNEMVLTNLEIGLNKLYNTKYEVSSLLCNITSYGKKTCVINPANVKENLGSAVYCDIKDIPQIIQIAKENQKKWLEIGVENRSLFLEKLSDIMEENRDVLIVLLVKEAGKTLKNAISEIREAVDFCRYYAKEARNLPLNSNALGTVVAISPWNFPLAIFIGQIVASLVVGNTVVAKSAEQTMLISYKVIEYLYLAGVPRYALQLVLGDGQIGQELTKSKEINGVIFTGSFEVANLINKTLLSREDNPSLIAETGGQNAMIVDSTALPEQVVQDVILSAFDSTGQRCSALRVLCLQDDIADKFIYMLKGAMDELKIGNPVEFDTDIGPVIDSEAKSNLLKHINFMKKIGKSYYEINLPKESVDGYFIAPIIFEIDNLNELKTEVFGPVLHIVRYVENDLDNLIDAINSKGYALTFGVHSRINRKVDHIVKKIEAGNIYVNRNMVGAVVGVQPFGGHGLSGTGPKAGGPFYLQKLVESDNKWIMPQADNLGNIQEHLLNELEYSIKKISLNREGLSILSKSVGLSRIGSLYKANLNLDGPTGEMNVLSWKFPSKVWVYGGNLNLSLSAFFELASNGIKVYIKEDHSLAKYFDILNKWLVIDNQPWMQNDIDVCVIFNDLPIDIKSKISNNAINRPLIKIIDASKGFDILKVSQELSLSVNTTASGGNVNLMSMSDE